MSAEGNMTTQKSFTNEFGQQINIGDEVIVVTDTCHRVSVSSATFLGVSERGHPQVGRPFVCWMRTGPSGDVEYALRWRDSIGWPHREVVVHPTKLNIITVPSGRVYKLEQK